MGNLAFIVELLIAELLLIFNYPRKKYFFIKFPIGVVAVILFAYFIPLPSAVLASPLLGFIRFVLLLAVSTLMMLLCFQANEGAIISGCVAGYAVQHLTYQVRNLFCLIPACNANQNLTEALVYIVMYIIIFFTLSLYLLRHNYYELYDDRFAIISGIILFICLVIYRFARNSASDTITTICISIYSITCCLLSLAIQYGAYALVTLRANNKVLETIITQKEKQYEISKQNMELLNIKCHDLKHYLNADTSQDREEIQKIVDIYDNPVKTGYDVLDVTINEKLKIMHDKGISVNFMGDGKLLSFMSDTDIYSLFGNALDNAIEALDKVKDKDKKIINISFERRGDLLVIDIRNFYNGVLKQDDGEILTSKEIEKGYHGYGIKSMRFLASKYQGSLAVHTEDSIFSLQISFLLNN